MPPPAGGDPPRVSVIVPAHAKAARLRLTLCALVPQCRDHPGRELLVVADGATAEVAAVLAGLEDVRVARTPGLGRAGARNAGARAAAADLLLFVDDDILTGPDFVSAHVAAQAAGPALVHGSLREMIGLLRVDDPADGGPGVPPVAAEALREGRWTPAGVRLTTSALERAAEGVFAGSLPVNAPWLASAGANVSVPRALWRAVGGYDEGFGRRWGMEDLDFGWRLWSAGHAVRLCEAARGYHMSHHDPRHWDEQAPNLDAFLRRVGPVPEALALPALLSPAGSPEAYAAEVVRWRNRRAPDPSLPTPA